MLVKLRQTGFVRHTVSCGKSLIAILFELTQSLVSSYGIAFPPNESIGDAVWGRFVPKALASGLFKAKPDPLVVGHWLKSIQDGFDRQKQVSPLSRLSLRYKPAYGSYL
jgi:hypothetical protein